MIGAEGSERWSLRLLGGSVRRRRPVERARDCGAASGRRRRPQLLALLTAQHARAAYIWCGPAPPGRSRPPPICCPARDRASRRNQAVAGGDGDRRYRRLSPAGDTWRDRGDQRRAGQQGDARRAVRARLDRPRSPRDARKAGHLGHYRPVPSPLRLAILNDLLEELRAAGLPRRAAGYPGAATGRGRRRYERGRFAGTARPGRPVRKSAFAFLKVQ